MEEKEETAKFNRIAKTFAKGLIDEEKIRTEIEKAKISKENLMQALKDMRTYPDDYVWQSAIVALKDTDGRDVTEALLKCVLEHNAVIDKLIEIIKGRKDFQNVLSDYYTVAEK